MINENYKKFFKMKRLVLFISLVAFLYGCGATKTALTAENTSIRTIIDLVNVNEDRVNVSLDPGVFTREHISFYIPKTVPGTYSADNYGKYIENFKAYAYDGKELPVTQIDENTWDISDAKNLDKVSYLVNDTYDTEREVKEAVFSPAGTNIVRGETFMLNLHGFVGYFHNLKEVPYEISIAVPKGLTSTTSLTKTVALDQTAGKEVFRANRYFEVIDNPILYAKPNTATFQINDITVNLSVYSPNEVYSALSLKASMEQMMRGQKAFLGNIDSTKEYNILLHLSTLESDAASGFGALEHHTSTVVVLPEQMRKEQIVQAMVDVVSHEFFHIVTPLSVHSKEVQFFDFNDPKMSAHLWMYEGTTEYFANLFQVQQGLISEEAFYKRIMDKIDNAKFYDDSMSFTEMSRNILKEPYAANYENVYEKGTLINMALDLMLLELSEGEKSVLWLMKELSNKYGKDTPFEDDLLINEIVAMTYPEVKTFFDTHVVGNTPIDYNIYLEKVGLTNKEKKERTGYFLNGDNPFIDVDPNNNDAIYIRDDIELNSFFRDLGAKGGDIIKRINGVDIDIEAIRLIARESLGWKAEKPITMVVQRGEEEIIMEGTAGTPHLKVLKIREDENATSDQIRLRNIWMNGL